MKGVPFRRLSLGSKIFVMLLMGVLIALAIPLTALFVAVFVRVDAFIWRLAINIARKT